MRRSISGDPTEMALRDLVDAAALMPGGQQILTRGSEYIHKHTKSTNDKYIGCIFFPELEPAARLPVKFSTASAVFTQKDHCYLDTDMLGRCALVMLPKHVGMTKEPTRKWGNNFVPHGYLYTFITNYQDEMWGLPTMLLGDDIPSFYTNVRLIGCSIRIQYIGALMNVSGMGACCLNYGFLPGHESVNTVEDSDYVQHVGTSAGLRQIWAPKDQNDFNYMNLTLESEQYGDSTQAFMIYFSNLPPGSMKLRVDIVRHWEGIPNEIIFPYVSLLREPYSEITIDVVSILHEKCPFFFIVSLAEVQKLWVILKPYLGIFDKLTNNYEVGELGLYSKLTGKNLKAEDNPLEAITKELDLI